MPARFLKTAYEPPHNGLVEMRKRGLPWLAASSIMIILVLVASVSYLFMRDQQRGFLDQDSLFASPDDNNRTTVAPTEEILETQIGGTLLPSLALATTPGELEPTEDKPPNPLELEGDENEEQAEQRIQPVEFTTPSSEEGSSAIPWVADSTPSEETGIDENVEDDEEEVETTLVVPIVPGEDDSSEEEEEPMRGDYPDDFFRRTAAPEAAPPPSVASEASTTTSPSTTPAPEPVSSSTTSPTTRAASTLSSSTTPSPPSTATPSPTRSPVTPSTMTSSVTTTLTPPRTPVLPLSEFSRAAITATNEICADIARNILMTGGNAIDAAIAGAFCLGGVEPHAAGMGGGMMMTIYQKATGRCEVVNGRKAAPARVDTAEWERNPRAREHGYSSIAVPGALHGLLSAYRRFRSGRVEWSSLIQPTIQLVESGFPVSASLSDAVSYRAAEINETAGMRDIFLPNGLSVKERDVLRDARLAETLRKIATSRDPSHLFYRGELAERIVHEVKAKGGHISKSDLVLFSSSTEDGLTVELEGGRKLCGPAPPSAFAAMQAGLRVMQALNISSSTSEELFTHYLIEATKIALELTEELGDSSSSDLLANLTSSSFIEALAVEIGEIASKRELVLESATDVSSAHINIIDEHGNAVAVTMGLNRPFGALRRSESLGFVWNNALSAFSQSADGPNALQPKRRPMTGAMPFVMVEGGEVQLVGGATGDASSFSALLSTLARLIIKGEHLDEAIAAPRIDAASGAFESGAMALVRALAARGHASLSPLLGRPSGAATPLVRRTASGRLIAVCDPRARVDRCARGI